MRKITLLFLFLSFFGNAQFIKLHDFNYANDYVNGMHPDLPLVSDGTYLYGIAKNNGLYFQGIIFKIMPDGTGFQKIHDFLDTLITSGNIIPNSLFYENGFLYGTTQRGGANNGGLLYKIKTDGTGYVTLRNFQFTTGSIPRGSLISDGLFLYGLLGSSGGAFFKIKPDGTGYSVLLNFSSTFDTHDPIASLVSDGTYFYGVTYWGGLNDSGTVFKVLPDGTGFMKLYDLNITDGILPNSSLTIDAGYLYGTTHAGGINNMGTIFKIKTDGTGFVKLFDFVGSNGSNPSGPLVLNGNYLYGTTGSGGFVNNTGTAFKIKTDGTGYSQIINFDSYTQGYGPQSSLISDGTYLYGTTYGGGSTPINQAGGTVFKLGLLTGIEEKSKSSNSIIITPNPTSATLSITSSVDYDGIKIINSIGQTVLIQENKQEPISVSDLSNGIYFIQLLDKNGNLLKTEKFIKE